MSFEYKIAKSKLKQLQRLFKEGYTNPKARDEYDKLFYKYLKSMPQDMAFNFTSILGDEKLDRMYLNKEDIFRMCFDPDSRMILYDPATLEMKPVVSI